MQTNTFRTDRERFPLVLLAAVSIQRVLLPGKKIYSFPLRGWDGGAPGGWSPPRCQSPAPEFSAAAAYSHWSAST